MHKIILAMLLTLSTVAHAETSEWVDITASNTKVYSIKKQSVVFDKTTSGTPVVVGLVRALEAETTQMEVFQVYVSVQDCINESGTFVIANLDGKVTSKTPFVFDLGSVAAKLSEVICGVAKGKASQEKYNKPNKLI
jgi:ribonucleotide monophosphatase NagD (HAD superfamily)